MPKSFQNSAANAAVPVSFKHIEDTHLAYRMYLKVRWKGDRFPPKWSRQSEPWRYQDEEI